MKYVYKIQINEKYYIGSTHQWKRRKVCHLSKLNKGYHPNILLQNLYNKYGKDSLIFSILEEFDKNSDVDIIKIEQKYLDEHINNPNCINIAPVAGGGAVYKPTPESIAKGLETKRRKGYKWSGKTNYPRKMIESNIGRKHSDNAKGKISEGNKKSYANSDKRKKACKQNGIDRMKETWDKYNKPFKLIKDGVEYGPFKFQKEAVNSGIITGYHMFRLFTKRSEVENNTTIIRLYE
jgi:group I intron endonuclease